MQRVTTLVVTLLLALPMVAGATDTDLFAELPIVLSVSRLSQPLREAPGAMTVIDQELIRASGARVLSDLMRFVPGFQVTAPSQEAPRVTYHGLGEEFPSRLQVLVDGVSQYSPLYQGGVNWNLIPVALEDIARIEVLRGSNSVAYGANAFLGVVNIITLQAAETRGAALSVSTGSGGINDYFARWGGSAPGADFRFSIREQRDTGLDRFGKSDRSVTNYNDDRRNRVISLRADLYTSDRDVVRLGFSEANNVNGQNDIIHDFVQRNQSFTAGWQRTLSSTEDFRINYALVREFADDTHRETSGPFVLSVNYGGNAERHDFDAQHTFSPRDDLRLVWGGGVRAEAVNQALYYFRDVRQRRSSTRVFANTEWSISPQWLLNAGASLEHDSLGGNMFAPRLSLHHHVTRESTLRLGASRAFRAPSLFEQRADWRWVATNLPNYAHKFLASGNLLPERVDSLELGYVAEFKRLNLSLDIRAFHERVSNRISTVKKTIPPIYCTAVGVVSCNEVDYAVNGERVDIQGVEYQARWQPVSGTRVLLNQSFVSTRSNLLAFETTKTAADLQAMLSQTRRSAPESTTTLMLMQKLPWDVDLSIAQHHVDSIQWTSSTVDAAASYIRTDWRLAKSFRVGAQNVEVAYTGRSAFDEHGEFRNHWQVTPRHFVSLRFGL